MKTLGILLGLLLMPAFGLADQLAYLSKADAERAAAYIETQRLMVSYCSLCNQEPVELWHVQEVKAAHTGYQNYYQVVVRARRILTSTHVYNEGEYVEPVEFDYVGHPDSALEELELDLAYVYSPSGGAWKCLGRILKMECEVRVETIRL